MKHYSLDNAINISPGASRATGEKVVEREFRNLYSKAHKRILFDDESKIIFVIVLVGQLLLNNGFYLFVCMLAIYIIFYYLQQPLKPAIFMVVALNHFVQIIAAIWQANSVGKDINFRAPDISDAIIASCIGLLALFIHIIYFQNKLPSISLDRLKKEAHKLSIENTFN